MLARVDAVDLDIAVDTQIGNHLAPFADAAARLDEIPGIGPTAAGIIIAEIGIDRVQPVRCTRLAEVNGCSN